MMTERIGREMEAFGLPEGSVVTVALSGGADSVALLHLLSRLPARRFQLEAAHINHNLRGEEALRDQHFCEALCAEWKIPLQVFSGDAAALAAERGMSLEEGARALRYGFLAPLADGERRFVATAHHREDQLETFFINLYRGSGSGGLSGMKPRRGGYLHPMLAIEKREILQYAAEQGLSFMEDATNRDTAYLRNFLRHQVIPLLNEREEGCFSAGLAAAMECLRAEDEALLQWADSVSGDMAEEWGALPDAVLKRVLDRHYGAPLDRLHFKEIAALIRKAPPAGQVQLAEGRYFRLEYGRCIFTDAPQAEAAFAAELDCPILRGGQEFLIRLEEINTPFTHSGVDYDKMEGKLTFRHKKAGDRFLPAGKSGTSRLQKRLKNDRIPRSERDALWVVADGLDRVVWAEGYGPAAGFECDEKTKRVCIITIK